ncbi:type II CAAX endopeptidase family protein [Spirochaetia bacterium 38H-sp]|uniref:Type II CAAX endopeptidase family protein n=1 Tax=Rarispira pelagica TaxID=3141764 RepID=A0ABU9UCW3_9SPIR
MQNKNIYLLFAEFITVTLIILLDAYISQLYFTNKLQFSYITLLNLLIKAIPSAALILFLRIVMIRWGVRPFQLFAPVKAPVIKIFATFGGILAILLVCGIFFSLVLENTKNPGNITGISEIVDFSNKEAFYVLIPILLIGAYWEELLFRSYMISRLRSMGADNTSAIFVSSTLFGLGHLYEGGFVSFVVTASIGAFLGRQYLKYKNIHIISIAHFLYNLFVIAIALLLRNYV